MKLWKLSQVINDDYDTYDSIIVVAENEEKARNIDPYGNKFEESSSDSYGSWAYKLEDIKVEYIGEASSDLCEGMVVLASFNAG